MTSRPFLLGLGGVAVVLVFLFAFVMLSSPGEPDFASDDVALLLPTEVASTPVVIPAMTREAEELSRVAMEHSRLLTSIPPTPTPTAEPLGAEGVGDAVVLRLQHPDGVPFPTPESENWFDETKGIEFYRSESGDWTPPVLRDEHPYRELFYFSSYPEGVVNFSDGSLGSLISRRMAYRARDLTGAFGEPSDFLLRVMATNFGWEIRHPSEPVVNVWTTFEYREGGVISTYALGAVMELSLSSVSVDVSGEEVLFEFLDGGEFLGPVVLERLATRSG